MRFNDDDYLKAFAERGEYPKIHDDIYCLDRYVKGLPVLDLGCCTGLLTRRLVRTHDVIVGVECNEHYLEKAIRHDKIEYINMRVDFDTLPALADIIKQRGIKCIYARRVFPEIYETGCSKLVTELIDLLHDCEVEYLVIEGRKSNKNAVNPLYNVEQEINALKGKYAVIKRYKNCAVMQRRQS